MDTPEVHKTASLLWIEKRLKILGKNVPFKNKK